MRKERKEMEWVFLVKIVFTVFTLLTVVFLSDTLFAKDEVKISILAVNPSQSPLDAEIVNYLPPEIKPEDVIDRSGLEVKYDREKQAYYLAGKVPLGPKETQTINVRVKNVWILPEDEIAKIQEENTKNLKALEGTPYFDTAKLLNDKIVEKLNSIVEEKNKAKGMRQTVELYRAQVEQLRVIEKDVMSLDSMRQLKNEQEEGGGRTAKFVITAENPSDDALKMTVRSDLPKEITAEDVIDRLGFLLLYNSSDQRFVLEKEDTLQGKEKKKYEITLRDIWYIPQERLDLIKKQTETILGHFKGSAFGDFAKQQAQFIYDTLSAINALQDEISGTAVIDDRIRAYVLNKSRLELVNRKLKDLQDLLLEIPMKRQESTIEQIRKAVRSLANIVDIIKLGFKPDLSTTWWIILGVIVFLFVMAASFYVIWVSKLKDSKVAKKKGKAQGPAGHEAKPSPGPPPK